MKKQYEENLNQMSENIGDNNKSSENYQPFIEGRNVKKFSPLYRQVLNMNSYFIRRRHLKQTSLVN